LKKTLKEKMKEKNVSIIYFEEGRKEGRKRRKEENEGRKEEKEGREGRNC
jgi:hypothetical protein